MAPTLSWERWSLAVCLGDKTNFPAAWLCRVGPGAGTGSRRGGQQQIPERAESPHTETTHTQTQADQLTPHTPDHGGIGAVARDRRVAERAAVRPGWRFRPASRDTALVSAQNQRRLQSYAVRLQHDHGRRCCPGRHRSAFASARRPGRERERGASTSAVTSWATRREKHAHHKTSRRRRRSGEDLGHPADERCGGLA